MTSMPNSLSSGPFKCLQVFICLALPCAWALRGQLSNLCYLLNALQSCLPIQLLCPEPLDRNLCSVRTPCNLTIELTPRGNGVMDSALACCAGSPGLIPAIGKSKNCNIQMGFFSLLA